MSNTQDGRYHLREDETLFFIHIPKTAGTTLELLLAQQFSTDEIHPLPTAPEFHNTSGTPFPTTPVKSIREYQNQLTAEEVAPYRLLMGHFTHELYARIPTLVPITMLRDPIQRTISEHRHLARHGFYPMKYHRAAQDRPMGEFLNHPEFGEILTNRQVKYIAGLKHGLLSADLHTLATAKANLERMAFVGLTERFAESMLVLSHVFSWPPFADIPRVNTAPTSSLDYPLTDEDMAALQHVNQLDLELYDYAVDLYNQRFDQMMAAAAEDNSVNLSTQDRYKVLHPEEKLPRSLPNFTIRRWLIMSLEDSAKPQGAESDHSDIINEPVEEPTWENRGQAILDKAGMPEEDQTLYLIHAVRWQVVFRAIRGKVLNNLRNLVFFKKESS